MVQPNLRKCVHTALCKKSRNISPKLHSHAQVFLRIRYYNIIVIPVSILAVLTYFDPVVPCYVSRQVIFSYQYFMRNRGGTV